MTTLTVPRRFISLLVIVTAVCAVLAAVTAVGAVDIIFGLPLALVLPGAALVWAIDPWGRGVEGAERAMWSFGSSIGIVILGGLLLNLTGGLTRPHWLILSSAVVAVCAVVGWLRGGTRVGEALPAVAPEREERTHWVTSLSLRPVAILLASVLVVSGALVLSQRTSTESNREHFVQAWILPQPSGNVFSTSAQLGVRNEEGRSEALVIAVRVGSSQASSTTVDLKDGQGWTDQIARNPGQPVSATVAIASRSSSILDRVDLAKPS
jgi:uncharacterized membrane protein